MQQTAVFCKNPSLPYELAAVRIGWPKATDKAKQAVEHIKQAVKIRSGLDVLVPKPYNPTWEVA